MVVHSTSDFATLDTTNRFSRVQTLIVKGITENQVARLLRLVEDRHIETVFCTLCVLVVLAGQHGFLRRVIQLNKQFIVLPD